MDDNGRITGGYIEAEAMDIKTALSADKKRTFVPMVAVLKGLSDSDFFSGLEKSRGQAGLPPFTRYHYNRYDEAEGLDAPIFPSGISKGHYS